MQDYTIYIIPVKTGVRARCGGPYKAETAEGALDAYFADFPDEAPSAEGNEYDENEYDAAPEVHS